MTAHNQPNLLLLKTFNSDEKQGLTVDAVKSSRRKYGENIVESGKKISVFSRIVKALFEPMMIILLFGLVITFGINLGKLLKTGDGDFLECIGITIAISLSVALTVIMEGKSQKAFDALKKLSSDQNVKVLREGCIVYVRSEEVVVGDIVFAEAGDKIVADGKILSCQALKTDESSLTGESKRVQKTAQDLIDEKTPLAERRNMVYSGTFVAEGSVKYLAVAVGANAEIGEIAKFVTEEKNVSAPLNEKLSRLGKFVSIFGLICSAFVFVLSVVRLSIIGKVSFESIEDVFIRSIVLIVAAVPEGLPTTVAISLSLNVLKLAKSNALIKKLVATETVGCVSVICSDKTGTLTQNKMLVVSLYAHGGVYDDKSFSDDSIVKNCAINSTASVVDGKVFGSATEGALIKAMQASKVDYEKIKNQAKIIEVEPFDSSKKYSSVTVSEGSKTGTYYKGAPEVIFEICKTAKFNKNLTINQIKAGQEKGLRALAFCRKIDADFVFDGFVLIGDKLRDGVALSVKRSLEAGIQVKILTGDGLTTASAIAKSLDLPHSAQNVLLADEVERLTDEQLKKRLKDITVIARSTPKTKLRIVTLLQETGEVVAVTGDGVNDAPAIRHADIGIAMGSGSEITKQASDVILLDDSFDTILKAVSFGRNVFDNFQRFISFQLTVNLSSIAIIITFLILGFASPFSSMHLLWLNVIMDGPLALSLSLESRPLELSDRKPVKRNSDILNKKMLLRIVIHSFITCVTVTLQQLYNFMGVAPEQTSTVTITLFVFFQLFNAINCREVGGRSALKGIFDNKLLFAMLILTFVTHVLIVTFAPEFFGTVKLSALLWVEITAICSSILFISEAYKFVYRTIKKIIRSKNTNFAIMKKQKVT